ncbi:tRNA (adenosine(37)-N6)-threonylcarbamoyltransferase complex dimerization subunit type 1 TsaB [Streptomyces odontomachi]|uniref:tRNA (adenosine(37)-N6)-threonylcarbamoyltransferase complex dimerization subunit type 1 TsaB n=1 Tax=Streptomyces odontomachi TaxID=2944940 RepID=UPI00210930A7|nr:tRNA (adenosine(37)-N6)-threonylcarbamoyltransferase complex dimerization subunit type 1 TsaB [Streptomyces sp. ODS25]
MLLLALDTATPAVTVALHDGSSVLAASAQVDARRHGELLLPTVDAVLAEAGVKLAEVTDIAVGVGPGPYTGLRVGLMTADTFGFTLGVPVHGVCTLDGIAYAHGTAAASEGPPGPFVVATDARRKEVYWARYEAPYTRVTDPAVDRPADIAEQVAGVPAVGAGAFLYPDVFPDAREPQHVQAAAVASFAVERIAAGEGLPPGGGRAAGTADAADDAGAPGAGRGVPHGLLPPRPLYLRRPDAQVPKNYKVVTPR